MTKSEPEKAEPIRFKIETTVATSDMLKKLIGDNTPDEEENPTPILASNKSMNITKIVEVPKVLT